MDILQEYGARADETASSESDAARNMHTRTQGAECADHGVVTDGAVQIHVGEVPDLHIGGQCGAGTNDRPGPDVDGSRPMVMLHRWMH